MNNTSVRRAGAVAAALVTGLVVSAAPAQAANPAGVASLGSANFTKSGQNVVVPTQAPCDVDGQTSNTAPPVSGTGIKFGGGTSTCTRTVTDPQNDVTTTQSEATGKDFELSALMSAGGPRIKVASWKTTCSATQTGTNAGWQVGGMTGFQGLPQQIPSNYVHEVKKGNSSVVLATATFGETVKPEPNDGSIAMNLMHFRFTRESGITGEVVVGATACSPTP